MKENIKIALLVVIAGTLIVQTIGQRSGAGASSTEMARTAPPATPPANAAPKNTFDPLTAPTTPPPADAVPAGPTTTVSFANMEHDFGKVKQDSENNYTFKFTNTGSEPMIISNAQGSCGCTVPDYPKTPIAPGATADIKVQYKPGKQEGAQTKTVTVTANTEPSQTILRIKADVQKVG
ncbi:MAG TPA: DUF1573 domain-containing protein [Flavobacteriales bacterium]